MKPSLTRILAASSVAGAVGEERALIADDLELDHVGHAELAREAAGAHGLLGGVAARRVGQQRVALAVDRVEHVGLAGRQVDAAERDGHDLGARAQDGLAALLDGGELAGAHEQPRLEGPAADDERILDRRRRPSAVRQNRRRRTRRSRPCPRRRARPRPRCGAGRRPGCARRRRAPRPCRAG